MAAVAVIAADSTERVPAAVEVAAIADSCRDVAVAPWASSDTAWAGGSVEGAVVVVEVNGLVGEYLPVSQKQEVVDRILGAADVLQEEQPIRWGKQVLQLGGHQQAEAYPLEDGRWRNLQEGAVAVVAYRREVVADMVAVGLGSREVEARHRCVGVRPPVANLLSGPKIENRQEVAARVGTGQPLPCSLVHD